MTRKTVMVVEDEPIVAADLGNMLARLGYEVVGTTPNGAEAISLARHHQPDIVLMDIRLQDRTDGTQAAEVILGELDIPVVFCTAYTDEATLRRVRDTGPYGYLVKPFVDRELRTTLEISLERHAIEQRVKQAERLLQATLRSISDAVIATDPRGRITFMNPVAEQLTGVLESAALGQDLERVYIVSDPATGRGVANLIEACLKPDGPGKLEHSQRLLPAGANPCLVEDSCAPIRDQRGQVIGAILVFRDITERARRQAEREKLIVELQQALGKVETLSGMLPICAWCKKIRNDRGYWEQVERYVQAHSRAQFTHGICPECSAKLSAQCLPAPRGRL